MTALRDELALRAEASLDSLLESKVQWVVLVDNEVAGWISLDVTSRQHGIARVGYTIGESFRGMGVATNAVKEVTWLAFDPTGMSLGRLEAVAAVGNQASQRVLTKSGFLKEGIARGYLVIKGVRIDHVRFSRLVDDAPTRL